MMMVKQEILDYLNSSAECKSVGEISHAIGKETKYTRRYLRDLLGAGKIFRTGEGIGWHPYKYQTVEFVDREFLPDVECTW